MNLLFPLGLIAMAIFSAKKKPPTSEPESFAVYPAPPGSRLYDVRGAMNAIYATAASDPTQPPTIPPTLPPSEPPTIPPTLPPTIPPTLPPSEPPTLPPPVQPPHENRGKHKGWEKQGRII